ncbi:hypothetical protein BATDEDRAFT_13800 [Batrachochytrium dendrobatidis JAM81]|uniref:Cullin-1 n=2 Tax=Batrachochytrium dendrobatidis TaxID=109871 RepID=F4PAX7_BATDJ|nr:uncharacterized protein BATDEDRAFT_13800 [Batrachochytrium dendrobatidis JAM81]EGF77757.1 hypothetical protein BATDEDRAFT_13800 [Batrachochytrium dendrobatidis JAM81]|eukprot:XP_006681595.1 hypothetical protein BATDEDRAFT_13800 [Batrachochytrium dendrobatidis JAM81]
MNPIGLAAAWDTLRPGVDRILTKWDEGISANEYMVLYTATYDYCTNTKGISGISEQRADQKGNSLSANLIGADLYLELRRHIETHLQQTTDLAADLIDDAIINYYTKHWTKFTVSVTTLNHIFGYLNRHWVKREIDEGHKTIYEIYILALVSWRDHIFQRLQEKVIKAALKTITKQRNGETIDTGLLKTIVESCVSIGLDENDSRKSTLDIYKIYFEAPFIDATESYYKAESEMFTTQNPITEYMKKAEIRLQEEEKRVEMYLHASTQKTLITTCETVLIKNHTGLIQDEFQALLDNDRVDDLSRMYSLLHRVPEGLDRLRVIFEAHVRKQGLMAIEKVSEKSANDSTDVDPKLYVDSLLSVHKKYADLVQVAFRGEAGFVASLDKACREFTNRNLVCKTSSSKSPELLARYCDSLLRKSNKMAEDTEFEELLSSVMTVFKYVEDKDVFQKFYSKHLAKRLVNGTSSSDDGELLMLTKLKDACGHEYTSKLQRMFTDMGVSKDLDDAFKEQMRRNHESEESLDFGALVLNTASWPFQPPKSGLNIPDDLLKKYERFQRFYQSKHSGRKLTWLFQFCKGELKTNYTRGSKTGYTFQVSTYQMAVLLLYNTATLYTLDELLGTTGVVKDVLLPTVGLLVKAKILLVQGGALGAPSSRYVLNEDFKSKKVRINVNLPIKTEQKAESDDTHRTIEEDRKLLIQAAIVRVMKTRKTLKHVTLVTEVIQQLQTRFKPQVSDIKKCIDILLEKEFIERADNQKDVFNYLA